MKLSLTPDKRKAILIALGVLIALALPLMILLEDFVRDAIVLPAGYYIWYFGVILDALPESLLVGVLVLVLLTIALRSLRRKKAVIWQPRLSERQSSGNIRVWTDRINLVSQGHYSCERFEHLFGQLVMRWLAHEERLSLRETVRCLQAGEADVPPELASYLQRVINANIISRRSFLDRLKTLLARKQDREAALKRVAQEVEPALHFMEQQLRLVQGEELDE